MIVAQNRAQQVFVGSFVRSGGTRESCFPFMYSLDSVEGSFVKSGVPEKLIPAQVQFQERRRQLCEGQGCQRNDCRSCTAQQVS